MVKIIKKYENGVNLVMHVERKKVDYFVDNEYISTTEIEGLTEWEFIKSNSIYERCVGYQLKCAEKELIVEETGSNNQGTLRILDILEKIDNEKNN